MDSDILTYKEILFINQTKNFKYYFLIMNGSDSSGSVLKDLKRLSQSTILLNLGNFGSGGGEGGALAPLTPSSGGLVLYQVSKDHQPPILSYLDRPTYLAKGQTSYVIDPYVVA